MRRRDEWKLDVIATVLDNTATPLSNAARSNRTGLLCGNEAGGLDDRWQSLCGRRVTIPIRPGTDSLHVAVAAGNFLHHFTDGD